MRGIARPVSRWILGAIVAATMTACGGGGSGGGTGASAPTSASSSAAGSAASTDAGGVVLAWKPPVTNADGTSLSQLGGYRVLYGRSEDNLDQSVSIDDPAILDCMLEDLEEGIWYFAVVTRNAMGVEGPASNVVSKRVG